MEQKAYYLGIDLDDENAVISYFQSNMKAPETVSTVAGSEIFQIPLVLAKKKGIGQWLIGEEARKLALRQGEGAAERLLGRALAGENVIMDGEPYAASQLLTLLVKKLIYMAGRLLNPQCPDKLVICLETLSREATALFLNMAPELGLTAEQITLIDRKESFYYFAFSQKEELWLHDVCLFDYREGRIRCRRLMRSLHTTPQLITLTEEMREMDETKRDEAFLRVAQESLKGHIVSAVYLVGEGFEGDWMKGSLAFLCQGRRVFMGMNLYSKGACYAAIVKAGHQPGADNAPVWPFVYMGDNELKVNVSLKVRRLQKQEFYTLLNAGDNWYEAVGECEVLLDGGTEIDFWLQPPESREARLERLTLADLPKRPPKATRLRITAKPLSDTRVQIVIKDMGFGELFKSSDKTWEYVMAL